MTASIQHCTSCDRDALEELVGGACSHCRIREEVKVIVRYPILSGARPVDPDYLPPLPPVSLIAVCSER